MKAVWESQAPLETKYILLEPGEHIQITALFNSPLLISLHYVCVA